MSTSPVSPSRDVKTHDIYVTTHGHEIPGSPRPDLRSPKPSLTHAAEVTLEEAVSPSSRAGQGNHAERTGKDDAMERTAMQKRIAALENELSHAHYDIARGAALLRWGTARLWIWACVFDSMGTMPPCRRGGSHGIALACLSREKEAALQVHKRTQQQESSSSRAESRSLMAMQRQLKVRQRKDRLPTHRFRSEGQGYDHSQVHA